MGKDKRERLLELDLLRFLAALAVVLFHYTSRGYAAGASPAHFPQISELSYYGHMGVDIFFMISGFVILLSAWHAPLEKFAVSRILRIYPAFWIGATLTFASILVFQESPQFSFLDYLKNLTLTYKAFDVWPLDGVYWSLLLEVQFYVFVGVLILLRLLTKIELILACWFLLAILSYNGWVNSYVEALFFPEWSGYFIAGCIFYLARLHGFSTLRTILLLGTLVMNILFSLRREEVLARESSVEFHSLAVISIVAAFYLIFLFLAIKPKGVGLRWIWLPSLGALTYPLYLIHQVIGYELLGVLQPVMGNWPALALVLAGMLLLSWLIVRYPEPLLRRNLKIVLESLLDRTKTGMAQAREAMERGAKVFGTTAMKTMIQRAAKALEPAHKREG